MALLVHHKHSTTDLRPVKFTACVGTFIKNYNNVNQLVEMVEIHRMFGIKRFIFHAFDVGSAVLKYLQYYESLGIAEVIPWLLPPAFNTSAGIWYYGQMAAQLDCLYKSLYSTTYLAYFDLDEILVPRTSPDLSGIISNGKGIESCIHQFRHVCYDLQWPSNDNFNNSDLAVKYDINTLRKITRSTFIWQRNRRSKYLANVQNLIMPGIHFAWACRQGTTRDNVSPSDGLLHHYRFEAPRDKIPPGNTTDAILRIYADVIIRHIQMVHKTVIAE